jgi:hypothetical protein
MRKAIQLDDGSKSFLLLFLIAQLFFTNGVLLFLGGIVFATIFYYLQQPLKPSVFTVVFVYHFIQVAASVWLSNWNNVDIDFRSPSTTRAIIASYAGLFCVFVPIILYQNKIPGVSFESLKLYAHKFSIEKTFRAYVISYFAMNALGALAFAFGGLTQIIFSLVAVKWLLFLLFGLQVFIKKRMYQAFIFFTVLEFASGFISYFSEFKTPIFYCLFLSFFFIRYLQIKYVLMTFLIGGTLFVGMAYFQSIKGEYRKFLNQGGKSQTVTVEKDEAASKLLELAADTTGRDMDKSVASFLDRFQYTFHLAKAMDHVPRNLDFQNGNNWGQTISFVLTPRILNPDKPIYEASVKASKYTGILYSGYEQGVSFSLGYFADGYVDFGIIGMMFPLIIIGFLYGATYFYFMRWSSNNYLFNTCVVGAIYMQFFAYEMDSTYLLGRLAATLLTFGLLRHFGFPQLIEYLETPLIKKNDKNIHQHPLVPAGV